MFETYSQNNIKQPCQEVIIALQQCYVRQGGKEGEECVREELAHKKCFAQLLCHREAYRFYNERKIPLSDSKWKFWRGGDRSSSSSSSSSSSLSGGSGGFDKTSCATLVEVFAKPENELEIPEGVMKEDRVFCRKITMELAACLAKKRNRKP